MHISQTRIGIVMSDLYHVMESRDIGDIIYFPYLLKQHAEELADLMNRIEEARFERMGIPYNKAIANVYYVQEYKKENE